MSMKTLRANGLLPKIEETRLKCLVLKAGSRDDACLANLLWNAEEFLREAENRMKELLGEEEA